MGDWLEDYKEQFQKLWGNLSKRARIIIGVLMTVLILSLLYLIFWGGHTQYQPLFSQLEARDADAIVKKLEEEAVPYQISDAGGTILVPANLVHKLRLEMAGEGLPTQGVVGFEIFDQSSFGTTDFERQVNYYRALSGELSRSIQELDGIEFAKVQITAPKESLFLEEEKPAEASVLLKLKPAYQLTETQITAITNLVASSVQELDPERVTVVDTAGNLLTRDFSQEQLFNGQLSLDQFEIQRNFAETLRSDLQLMLSKILGPDNFTVQVKAQLNFDQKEVESREYYPVVGDEGIVRSEQEETEVYEGSAGGAVGIPGTTSNLPQYQLEETGEDSGNYERKNSITNYEINERVARHVYAPGKVERLSVAVVVNDSISEESLQKIQEIVEAAIAYDANRGDLVTVTSLAFDKGLEEEINQLELAAAQAQKTETLIYAGLIALILIVLVILLYILKPKKEYPVEEKLPGTAVDLMVGDAAEEAAVTSFELSEEEKKRLQLKEEIAKTISEKPEEVAQLIKSWLLED